MKRSQHLGLEKLEDTFDSVRLAGDDSFDIRFADLHADLFEDFGYAMRVRRNC